MGLNPNPKPCERGPYSSSPSRLLWSLVCALEEKMPFFLSFFPLASVNGMRAPEDSGEKRGETSPHCSVLCFTRIPRFSQRINNKARGNPKLVFVLFLKILRLQLTDFSTCCSVKSTWPVSAGSILLTAQRNLFWGQMQAAGEGRKEGTGEE